MAPFLHYRGRREMALDYQALKQEIDNDPLSLGYAQFVAVGSDYGVSQLLNATNYTKESYANISDIESYADSHNLRDGIEDGAASNPYARAASRLFAARYDTVDVNNTAFKGVLQGLVSTSVITQTDSDSIITLGNVPASRAEVLWGSGTNITESDVAKALRGI